MKSGFGNFESIVDYKMDAELSYLFMTVNAIVKNNVLDFR